jgi:hypothetical protein
VASCTGVPLRPGDPVPKLVADAQPGTTFCFEPGVHRISEVIKPHDGMSFIGAPGAVLRGSRVLTGWRSKDGRWAVGGQARLFVAHGRCADESDDSCARGESLFLDGTPLREVDARDDVGTGRFFLDEETGELVISDDPSGRLVEWTVAAQAIVGLEPNWSPAEDVTVKGLVVEQFGGIAQHGALDSEEATGWVVEGNEVRNNHGAGICTDGGSVVRGNDVHHNGQLGLCGSGSTLLIEGNHVHHNNTEGFKVEWEAGGSKWARTEGLTVRGNYVHDNVGFGLWTDIDNVDVRYQANLVEDNTYGGIFHEISYSATVTGNTIRRNGFSYADWGYGAGIIIAHSSDVVVRGNLLEGNYNGISLLQQSRDEHRLEDVLVSYNTIRGGATGIWQDVGDRSIFTSRGLVYRDNLYLRDGQEPRFVIDDASDRTWEEWRAAGQGAGSLLR